MAVGQVARDAVTCRDAGAAQKTGHAGNLVEQFGVGQSCRHFAAFADGHQRRSVVAVAQQVLGEIEAGALEPRGARHLWIFQHRGIGLAVPDAGEAPDGFPEVGNMGDRPIVQCVVTRKIQPVLAVHGVRETRQVGPRDTLRGGRPQQPAHSISPQSCRCAATARCLAYHTEAGRAPVPAPEPGP